MSKVKIVWFRDLKLWSVALQTQQALKSHFPLIELKEVLNDLTNQRRFTIVDHEFYKEPTISSKTNEISVRKSGLGSVFKVKKRVKIIKGDLVIAKMHTQNGLYSIANEDFASTTTFIPCKIIESKINKYYLFIILKQTLARLQKFDSVNRETYKTDEILSLQIPLPPLEIQQEIVSQVESIKIQIKALQDEEKRLKDEIERYIHIALGLEKPKELIKHKVFTINFKDLTRWDVRHNQALATPLQKHLSTEQSTQDLRQELKQKLTQDATQEALQEQAKNLTQEPQKQEQEQALTPPPQGWEVKTLGEVCELNPKVDLHPLSKLEKEISFLPMEAVKTDGKSFETLQRNAREAKGFMKFANHDLLWAKITPCMQNKKSLVVSELQNGYGFGSTEFFVLRPRDNRQTNIYLILQFLRLDMILQNAAKNLKGSAGQQRVPKEFLQNLQIPLPPLEIQEQIVNHVEKKQAKITSLQEKYKALQESLTNYLESCL